MKVKNLNISLSYSDVVDSQRNSRQINLTLQCYYKQSDFIIKFVQEFFKENNQIYNIFGDSQTQKHEEEHVFYCVFDEPSKVLNECDIIRAFLPAFLRRFANEIKKSGMLDLFISEDFSLTIYVFDISLTTDDLIKLRDSEC